MPILVDFPILNVEDAFTRTDEAALTNPWTSIAGAGSVIGMSLISNQIKSNDAYSGSYYGFYTDPVVYFTFSTLIVAAENLLSVRYQDAGGASPIRDSRRRGYQLNAQNTQYTYNRMDDGAAGATLISTRSWMNGNIVSGDTVGIRVVDNQHEIWLKRTTNPWILINSVLDSTYLNAGAVAIQSSDVTSRFDNMGAGEAQQVKSTIRLRTKKTNARFLQPYR